MKKIVLSVISIVIVMSFFSLAYAQGNEYEIAEFDLKVELPEGWIALTRDIEENNPNLEELGLNYDELLAQFDQFSIYLGSVRTTPLTEIVVSVIEHEDYQEINNFNLLHNEQLDEFCRHIMSEEDNDKITNFGEENSIDASEIENVKYSGYNIYKNNDITYVVLDSSRTTQNKTVCYQQYTTIVNGNMINITLKEYECEVTPEDSNLLKNIATSLTFGHIDEKDKSILGKFESNNSVKSVSYSLIIAGALAFIIVIVTNKVIDKSKDTN